MNVFEDLIEELKDENLLEETVIGRKPVRPQVAATSVSHYSGAAAIATVGFDRTANLPAGVIDEEEPQPDGIESYRKRAVDEVAALQMVEHVLSGIEREYMKMTPEAFDDLSVKKALHRFLQMSEDSDTKEYAAAETSLMQEVEEWISVLASRDSNIPVANLRRFCENSRPVLSSRALMALARFYRNSPLSEPVRGKFDFVMTRLFSRETDEGQRKLLFGRSEAIGHLKTLYSNWASLDRFSGSEYSDRIHSTALEFDALAAEALRAERFDDLVASDLFNRIRVFKEEALELFFAPNVMAAAIECNVKIGNRFVELARVEREFNNLDIIEAKYGHTYDTLVSSAAGKTLHLLAILKEEPVESVDGEPLKEEVAKPARHAKTVEFERAPVNEGAYTRLFKINKWLLAMIALALMASGAVYLWSENVVESQGDVEHATTVEMSDPELKQHLRMALASGETLYGVAQPSWDARSEEEQRDLLRRGWAMAEKLNMRRVNIVNYKGRTIGYASADKLELLGP